MCDIFAKMYNMMKSLYTSLVFAIVVLLGCSCGNAMSHDENLLVAFRLTSDGIIYNGKVDHSASTVTFPDITSGQSVEAATAFLAEGATISPDPKVYVGNWPEKSTFEITKGNQTQKYQVVLPNLRTSEKKQQVVMGYVQPSLWNFDACFDLISWDCLTHIIPSFCFAQPDASLKSDVIDNYIEQIASAAKEHGVKVLISIRSTVSKDLFSQAIATAELRETLANNIMDYVSRYDLDGVDIDFEEYEKIGANQDKLYDLFARIRSKMSDDMIFSSAIIPGAWVKYGTQWHTYFNYINIMSYDTKSGDTPKQFASFENYVWDVEYCHNELGIPYSKLAAGMPFYGHTWDNIPGTDNAGGVTFHNIMEYYRDSYPDAKNVDHVEGTYYNGHDMVRRKCEYAKENGLGGVMIWQLFQDARRPDESLLKVVGDAMYGNE